VLVWKGGDVLSQYQCGSFVVSYVVVVSIRFQLKANISSLEKPLKKEETAMNSPPNGKNSLGLVLG
jgi:hypothetical protein